MAEDKGIPYPKKNYVPMYPLGHSPTGVSDGSGKGNVSPNRADEPRGKGTNVKNYGGPNENYKPSSTSDKPGIG